LLGNRKDEIRYIDTAIAMNAFVLDMLNTSLIYMFTLIGTFS